MEFLKSTKGLYTLAFLLIIVTNIFVFVGAYSNKSGESTSSVTFTQRELSIPYSSHDENSGLSLKIKYRILGNLSYKPYSYTRTPIWLDETKLQELGFDTKKQKRYKNRRSNIKKEIFLVLELNGESYKKYLKLAYENLAEEENKLKENPTKKRLIDNVKDAKKYLNREENKESRLYVIDAGLSYEKLRKTYQDKGKYTITKGLVRSYVKSYKNSIPLHVNGYITGLSVSELHVEKKFKSKLKDKNAKFNIEVKYGSRYEPWISAVNLHK